jgi:DNA polymerase III delta prime subunit
MARMIPPHCHESAPNSERRVFNLLKNDPASSDWVVLHSLNLKRSGERPYGEVDFVVLVPAGGVFCIEVKGGRVACRDGVWSTTDAAGRTNRLKRSPLKQAEDGMHEIRNVIRQRLAGVPELFKVAFGHAVIFTDVLSPPLDAGTEPWEVIDCDALEAPISSHLLRIAKNQRRRFYLNDSPAEPQLPLLKQIREALRPDFDRVIARSTALRESERSLMSLTEEQYRTLDLLIDNRRCLFEGAAGTGKTLLALEFARRCASTGRRTLLICYNKLLGEWLANEARATTSSVTAGTFHKCAREMIVASPVSSEFLDAERKTKGTRLFEEVYPFYGQLALERDSQKYDTIIVDEAQDLIRQPVLDVLNNWLVGGLQNGRWAFFGDFHRQAIYGTPDDCDARELIKSICPSLALASLSQNCRNTRRIGVETALLSGFFAPPYRMGQTEGLPVEYHEYHDAESQVATLRKVLSQLAKEPGIDMGDVVILSSHRFERSTAAQLANCGDFRIKPTDTLTATLSRIPTFAFATVQAFKGMESKVILLCDVDKIETDEDRSLLYVAMSRARSHLTVLLHQRTKTAVRTAFKKRMTELWGTAS